MEKSCRNCKHFERGKCSYPLPIEVEGRIEISSNCEASCEIEFDVKDTDVIVRITHPTDFCCSKYE